MKIIVIGAGVIGVTTAWLLAQDGHQVTVLEEQHEIAALGSHANGGQLSYDFASPMASPELLARLPSLLVNSDAAFRIKHPMSLEFLRWSRHFAQQCLPQNYRQSTRRLKQLAKQSGQVLGEIVTTTKLDFDYRRAGKLVIYTKSKPFERSKRIILKSPANGQSILDATACLEIEPALQQCQIPIIGGVLAKDDAVGNAALFSQLLAADAEERFGVNFHLGTRVESFDIDSKTIQNVHTNQADFQKPDLVICCTGANNELLHGYDIKTGIFPVRGYSHTYRPGVVVPKLAITDHDKKVVYSRIGDKIRVAGFADFGHHSKKHDQQRLLLLSELAKSMFPDIADYQSPSEAWAGNRPATPDNLPIVGPCSIDNLYLNMGHGMFGWTLAAVTAEQLTQQVKKHA